MRVKVTGSAVTAWGETEVGSPYVEFAANVPAGILDPAGLGWTIEGDSPARLLLDPAGDVYAHEVGSGEVTPGVVTELPDASDAAAGNVLLLDDSLVPGWASPSAGVWKDYIADANGLGPIVGLTVGNGVMTAKWWTPAPVVADPATEPFLCVLYIAFVLGSTSAVTGHILVGCPNLVDGSANDLRPAAGSDAVTNIYGALASAQLGSDFFPGFVLSDAPIISPDGTPWDATHPGAWAAGDSFSFAATFQAKFVED